MNQRSGIHRLSNAAPLLRVLGKGDIVESVWDARDLPSMWIHQLRSGVVDELKTIDPAWGLLAERACSELSPPIVSFADLFDSRKPPISVLDLVKRYAKIHLDPATAQLPREIAGGIYVESILSALARGPMRISSYGDAAIVEMARSLLGKPWIDDSTRVRIDLLVGIVQRSL